MAAHDVALQTDRYELTMLASAIADGTAELPAAFAVFARRLPDGARYGQVAGIGRFLELLDDFGFDADTLDWLEAEQVIDGPTRTWLTGWRFRGDIEAYPEGELYAPGSPVVVVRGRFGDALLLETLLLSVLNHDTAVMTKAARIVEAAAGTPVLELGSRRTHEGAAVGAARATFLAGFAATSNLAAGRAYGIPTVGTAAHAWTLAHAGGDEAAGERAAFDQQIATHGPGTTLLVDTFDIGDGIRRAVAAAQAAGASGPGAVRIDSGDLGQEARAARQLLDELGAHDTRIVVSGDLDEDAIVRLETAPRAPIDGYGVGTRAVAGLTPPGFVYKLVEIGGRPVSKRSTGKVSPHGVREAWRELDESGYAVCELLTCPGATPAARVRRLREAVVTAGKVLPAPSTAAARDRAVAARDQLRPLDRRPGNSLTHPAFTVHDLADQPAAAPAQAGPSMTTTAA